MIANTATCPRNSSRPPPKWWSSRYQTLAIPDPSRAAASPPRRPKRTAQNAVGTMNNNTGTSLMRGTANGKISRPTPRAAVRANVETVPDRDERWLGLDPGRGKPIRDTFRGCRQKERSPLSGVTTRRVYPEWSCRVETQPSTAGACPSLPRRVRRTPSARPGRWGRIVNRPLGADARTGGSGASGTIDRRRAGAAVAARKRR